MIGRVDTNRTVSTSFGPWLTKLSETIRLIQTSLAAEKLQAMNNGVELLLLIPHRVDVPLSILLEKPIARGSSMVHGSGEHSTCVSVVAWSDSDVAGLLAQPAATIRDRGAVCSTSC